MLISIVGIDGCGKSTVVDFLDRKLNSLGKEIHLESYPSKWLRDQNLDFNRLNSIETIAFFLADIGRSQLSIVMNLSQKDFVITDRYHYCTYAYNCDSPEDRAIYVGLSNTFVKPDLTVLIDIPVIDALNRIADRQDSPLNYFEQKEKLELARKHYMQRMSAINYEQMLLVNGNQSVDAIVDDILSKIKARNKKNNAFK